MEAPPTIPIGAVITICIFLASQTVALVVSIFRNGSKTRDKVHDVQVVQAEIRTSLADVRGAMSRIQTDYQNLKTQVDGISRHVERVEARMNARWDLAPVAQGDKPN